MSGKTIPFKKNMIQGGAIVLAALIIACGLVWAVRTLKSFDDTVKVRGLCEREVPADRVVFRINYSLKMNSLADVRQQISHHNDVIIAKLKAAGIADDEIAIANLSIDDRYQWSNDISKISYRYSATQTITVFTAKLDVVSQLQKSLESELLKQDILASTYADYQYQGLNDIKPSMIAESLDNARAAADEFAKNSHSRIGKMRTASQGYFEVVDLDENTPQVKKVRVVTTVEYYLK